MKRDLSQRVMRLPLRSKVRLVWRMLRDPDVPGSAKAVLPLIALYLALPFDLVPDRIPVLGEIDDLLVIALGFGMFVLLTPGHVVERHLTACE